MRGLKHSTQIAKWAPVKAIADTCRCKANSKRPDLLIKLWNIQRMLNMNVCMLYLRFQMTCLCVYLCTCLCVCLSACLPGFQIAHVTYCSHTAAVQILNKVKSMRRWTRSKSVGLGGSVEALIQILLDA